MKKSYLLFICLLLVVSSYAQFSSDPSAPLSICNEASSQGKVKAVNDVLNAGGGYYVFWIDQRSGSNAQVYAQHLDKNGNALWAANGKLIQTDAVNITAFQVINWNKKILVIYTVNQDSVKCMLIDKNGNNVWSAPTVIASGNSGPVLYVTAECLNAFPTTTGANITYYITFFGGSSAIGFNKIDFSGNRQLNNNEIYYQFSGYDYRSASDGQDGVYVLSKSNGIGSTMTIDRLNASGGKQWSSGVEITDGGGSLGFAGNISMNVDTKHDLYVTWDAANGNVLHTKVLNTGLLGWSFKRREMSVAATPNASRCHAAIKNGIVCIAWFENTSITNATLQAVSSSGTLLLPAGGKVLGEANGYYEYPRLAFGSNSVVCFYSANASGAVGINAQGLYSSGAPLYTSPKTLSNAYLKWNFYNDFVAMDDAATCNAIFWTGVDGNIYGANTCSAAQAVTANENKAVGTDKKYSITAYPNPAENFINITLNSKPAKNAGITVCNLQGIIVKQLAINSTSTVVDISRFLPGMYFIKYKDDAGTAITEIQKR